MTAQPETESSTTAHAPVFRRILLKLSGEALMGEREYGIDPGVTQALAREVAPRRLRRPGSGAADAGEAGRPVVTARRLGRPR